MSEICLTFCSAVPVIRAPRESKMLPTVSPTVFASSPVKLARLETKPET